MSEDRRALPLSTPADAPNGQGFAPARANDAGDDAIVDGASSVLDAATSTSSTPPPAVTRDGVPSVARRRLSLRIPDDEIARPKRAPEASARSGAASPLPPRPSAPPPEPQPLLPPPSLAPLTPMRIITINADPAMARELPPEPSVPPEPPTVPTLVRDRSDVPSSPDVTVDLQVPTPRAPAPLEADEVEVRFEDEATPALPRAVLLQDDLERRSEPPPEVAAEDVVTVEAPPPSSLGPMRPRAPSQPPVPRPLRRTGPGGRPPLVIVPPHVGSIPPQANEAAGTRRKGRLWWEDLFNDDYVRASERVTEDHIAREVHFIEESLGVERGGALLDLACGAGRHAVELARRGYEVVGFDLSLAMLARAGEEAQEREAKLNFVQGDMREMTFDEQFDGVYCWNTSFGYFEEDKNAQVIDRVHRSLKGGGLFLLDIINRDFLVRQSPSLAWFEGDGCVCMDEMSMDFITSRMKVKRTMMVDDGRSREIEYSMRVYSLHELGRILHEHGFKVREVSGGLAAPGVFFGNESPRVIVLAEKR